MKFNNEVIKFKGQQKDLIKYSDFLQSLEQIKLEGTTQELFNEFCFVENYKENKVRKYLIGLSVLLFISILAGLVYIISQNMDQLRVKINSFRNIEENKESLLRPND